MSQNIKEHLHLEDGVTENTKVKELVQGHTFPLGPAQGETE